MAAVALPAAAPLVAPSGRWATACTPTASARAGEGRGGGGDDRQACRERRGAGTVLAGCVWTADWAGYRRVVRALPLRGLERVSRAGGGQVLGDLDGMGT